MFKLYVRINRTKDGKITGIYFPGLRVKHSHKGITRLTSVASELSVIRTKSTITGEDGKEKPIITLISARIKSNADLIKTRLRDKQLVLTPEGFGTIKDYTPTFGVNGLNIPYNLCIEPMKKGKRARFNKIEDVKFIDVIDDKTGERYPALESDYFIMFMNDMEIEFTITKSGKALLTPKSRLKLEPLRIFGSKQDGIKVFNELSKVKGWNPLEK